METQNAKNRHILIRGILGGAVAGIINGIIYLIARASDVSFTVPSQQEAGATMDIGIGPIIIFSVVPAVIASLLVLLLNRFTRKPFTIYLIIAVIILLVSFFPLTLEMDNITRIVLGIMHVIVASGITIGLNSAYRSS